MLVGLRAARAALPACGPGGQRCWWDCVAIENDAEAQAVIMHHFPEAVLLGDLKTVEKRELSDVASGTPDAITWSWTPEAARARACAAGPLSRKRWQASRMRCSGICDASPR